MINSPFRTAVSSAFDDMTEDQDESSGRMLVAPNPGGLSAFLIGCLDSSFGDKSPKASLFSAEAIVQVFDAKGWDLQMSFVKGDLFVLLDALMDVEPEMDVSDTVPALSAELQTLARAKDTKKNAGMQPGPECSNRMLKDHSSTIEEEPSKEDKPQHAEEPEAEFVDGRSCRHSASFCYRYLPSPSARTSGRPEGKEERRGSPEADGSSESDQAAVVHCNSHAGVSQY